MAPLWLHRVSMIAVLPFVVTLCILIGPFMALCVAWAEFRHHWRG